MSKKLTIYTEPNRIGTSEVPPFVVGDATDEWELEFINELGAVYVPSAVSMRVGHINGLPDGSYADAFVWTDRADNASTASITITAGVPSLSFDVDPLGGVIGSDGVYVLRGPQLDGRITSIEVLAKGAQYLGTFVGEVPLTIAGGGGSGGQAVAVLEIDPDANPGGATVLGTIDQCIYTQLDPGVWTGAPTLNPPRPASMVGAVLAVISGSNMVGVTTGNSASLVITNRGGRYTAEGSATTVTGTGTATGGTVTTTAPVYLARARVGSVTLLSPGSAYVTEPVVADAAGTFIVARPGTLGRAAVYRARIAAPKFSTPYFSGHSSAAVLAACKTKPYTDGKIDASTEYDHSVLVIRPRDVAAASLTAGPASWTGTMNPINAYVQARLAVARSTVLDLQIFGDGRMLFQGALAVLDRIT